MSTRYTSTTQSSHARLVVTPINSVMTVMNFPPKRLPPSVSPAHAEPCMIGLWALNQQVPHSMDGHKQLNATVRQNIYTNWDALSGNKSISLPYPLATHITYHYNSGRQSNGPVICWFQSACSISRGHWLSRTPILGSLIFGNVRLVCMLVDSAYKSSAKLNCPYLSTYGNYCQH